MFSLNQKSKRSIARLMELPFEEVVAMDASSLDSHVEKKIKKQLKPSYRKGDSIVNRGSVYMFLQRLVSRETIDKKLSRI